MRRGAKAQRHSRRSLNPARACIDSPTSVYVIGTVLGSLLATVLLVVLGALA